MKTKRLVKNRRIALNIAGPIGNQDQKSGGLSACSIQWHSTALPLFSEIQKPLSTATTKARREALANLEWKADVKYRRYGRGRALMLAVWADMLSFGADAQDCTGVPSL